MANVVRDPKVHPDAIIPDLSKPDPLVKFTKDDIAFVYGSRWKQRYFTKRGDDYFPLGAQWEVKNKKWMFYGFEGSAASAKPIPATASCYSCHAEHGAVDNTFVQFYPTLIEIARQKGTFREEKR